MPVLVALQTLFTVWMLVDAMRRQVPCYWYMIIMVPIGAWAYFFAVKINDPGFQRFKGKLCTRPASLEDLEYLARKTPSVENKLVYAQALYDKNYYSRALETLKEVLEIDSENKKALYGIGRCLLNLSEAKSAVEALEKLVKIDASYSDYGPCYDLAQAYWSTNQHGAALKVFEDLCQQSQRIGHKIEYANYLSKAGKNKLAREVAVEALEDYEHSPAFIRKNNKKWAKAGRRLLKSL
jgi:hypothetical protein